MATSIFKLEAQDPRNPLETTRLINATNPTVVGVWNLDSPSHSKTSKRIRLPRETLGPGGDHRTKAPKNSFTPGGKYRAICKLFMAYKNIPGEEFIGTGWLIANDLITTAGHCLYDHETKGGFLTYVKAYFVYSGPESVNNDESMYRYGVAGACPAEFIKAESDTHDVGFIRLNNAVNIDPLAYISTPTKANVKIGVVGFPGDRDFGHYLYEHWQKVEIDLAKTSAVLNYKIDTTGGQSGSPVLWLDPVSSEHKAIGVHIAGGYPNIGSTIGPIGNKFEEYTLALRVKDGFRSASAEILLASGTSPLAPGFQIISIKPSPESVRGKCVAQNGTLNGNFGFSEDFDDDNDKEDDDDEDEILELKAKAETEIAILALFGKLNRQRNGRVNGKPARKTVVARGEFLRFPETLRLDESDPVRLAVPDYDAAVTKAMEQNDIQTVFFVNFAPTLKGAPRKSLKKLMESIQSWQSWSSTICEGKVQEQIDSMALPADSSAKSMMARSTYRSKVFDYLMRRSSWFAKTFDQNISKHIEVRKAEFHTAILTAVLEGFTVPSTVYIQLEKLLDTISDGILELGSNKSEEAQQYWIMLTRYDYQPLTDTISPVIRVISFQVNQTTADYTLGKNNISSVSFDLSFGQYQTDFNAKIYKKIQDTIDTQLVELGKALVGQKTFDIPV